MQEILEIKPLKEGSPFAAVAEYSDGTKELIFTEDFSLDQLESSLYDAISNGKVFNERNELPRKNNAFFVTVYEQEFGSVWRRSFDFMFWP